MGRHEPDEVADRLRRQTRRGFAAFGLAALSGLGAWRWLATRPGDAGIPWPLRRVLGWNEEIAEATFSRDRLAPDFGRSRAREPRVNGLIGMADRSGLVRAIDPASWRLDVSGGPGEGATRVLTLDDVKALPRVEQTTELKCIEGWSTVVHWAGARLVDLAATTGLAARSGAAFRAGELPADLLDYVGLATPDGGYAVGLDMPSALHTQTLLAYEMNGEPLTAAHGAPLRLVIPVKYGIKHIKQIATIRFTDRRPGDYWALRGYDWYSGH